ncbi:MAG: hypothetical protein AB1442_07465 [Nitrospirota bacterium]
MDREFHSPPNLLSPLANGTLIYPKDLSNLNLFLSHNLNVVRAESRNIIFVDVQDDGILFDLDTKRDYILMLKRFLPS